jgi:hypothetical protein
MAINGLGSEKRTYNPPPVTLPRFSFKDDIERECREAASRVAEKKIIRAGIDAWQAIGKADSFGHWKAIGAALAVGKAHALKVTGANAAWGQNYSRVFCDWMKEHRFDRMPKSTRSVAIELHENLAAIETWRSTLTEKQRLRLQGPLQNIRRWKRETGQVKNNRCNARAKAEVAWRRFVSCVEALPPDQAAPLCAMCRRKRQHF